MNENGTSSWLVPVAIVAGLLLIGGALYYQGSDNTNKKAPIVSNWPAGLEQIIELDERINLQTWRSIDASDKVRGNINAPLKLVVYTDLECPACGYFHKELKKLEADYVDTGKLAIILRNFPLDSLHPKARTKHLAAECVNAVGGQEKYWQFMDKIFEVTPTTDGLDLAELDKITQALAIDMEAYKTCVNNKEYADEIEQHVKEAVGLGAQGTPFSVLVAGDLLVPIYGGYPAERLVAAFDLILASQDNKAEVETNTIEDIIVDIATTSLDQN